MIRRIVILCEGPSDERVLKILGEWLKLGDVHLEPKPLGGQGKFYRKDYILPRVTNTLKEPGTLAVFALVDLKGARVDFTKGTTSFRDKAMHVREYLKSFFSGQSIYDRFYPHIAVHDIEAWILADKQALSGYFGGRAIHSYDDSLPEALDFDNPPKNRLKQLFRENGKEYRPSVHAPELFSMIKLDKVYSKCPNFKAFVDDLRLVVSSI